MKGGAQSGWSTLAVLGSWCLRQSVCQYSFLGHENSSNYAHKLLKMKSQLQNIVIQ